VKNSELSEDISSVIESKASNLGAKDSKSNMQEANESNTTAEK
jgi:hypothetical protein